MKLIVVEPAPDRAEQVRGTNGCATPPGTEMHLLRGLSKVMLDEGLVAEGSGRGTGRGIRGAGAVAQRCAARRCGEDARGVPEADDPAGGAGVRGREAGEHHLRPAAGGRAGRRRVGRGTRNLAILAGQAAKEDFVFLEAVEHANSWGARDMGVLPDSGPGYTSVSQGFPRRQMLDAAVAGQLKALFVMGNNLLVRYPNGPRARQALEALDFLVVQDSLPDRNRAACGRGAAGRLRDGEERHVHQRRGPGAADGARWTRSARRRPDWQIFAQLRRDRDGLSPLGYGTIDQVVARHPEVALGRRRRIAQRHAADAGGSAAPVTTPELYPLKLITGRLMFDHSTVQLQSTVLHTLAAARTRRSIRTTPDRSASQRRARGRSSRRRGKLELMARVERHRCPGRHASSFRPATTTAPVNTLLPKTPRCTGVRIAEASNG